MVATAWVVEHGVYGAWWLFLALRFGALLLASSRGGGRRMRVMDAGGASSASTRKVLSFVYARAGCLALLLLGAAMADPRGVYGVVPYRWGLLVSGNASAVVLACCAVYVFMLRRTLLVSRGGRMRGMDAASTRALRRWRALVLAAAALSLVVVNARSAALLLDNRRLYNGALLLATGGLYVPLLLAVFLVTTCQLQGVLSLKLHEAPYSSHSRLGGTGAAAGGGGGGSRLELSVRRSGGGGGGGGGGGDGAAPPPVARQKSWANKRSRRYIRSAKQRLFAIQMLLTWVGLAVCSVLVSEGLSQAVENPDKPLDEPEGGSYRASFAFTDASVLVALCVMLWLSSHGVGHGVVRSRSGSSRSVSRADPPSRVSSARGLAMGADAADARPPGSGSLAAAAPATQAVPAGRRDEEASEVKRSGLRYGGGRAPVEASSPADVVVTVEAVAEAGDSDGDDAAEARGSEDETPESSVSD